MTWHAIGLGVALFSVAPAIGWAADPPSQAAKAGPMVRTYVATGPTTESDLARLRDAIAKVSGVEKVDARADRDRIIVSVQGDVGSIQSVLSAAARSVGFMLRPAPTRYFVAAGPTAESGRLRLQTALRRISGVEQVAVSPTSEGIAIRVTGVASASDISAAGANAGYGLRCLNAYVVSGSAGTGDLERLRSSLKSVEGVEQVQYQALIGGATLLVYGEAPERRLIAAAKPAGYDLWPLGNPAGPLEFRLSETVTDGDRQKVLQALRAIEGVEGVSLKQTSTTASIVVPGSRTRPEALIAEARRVGVELTLIDTVTLPSLAPQAGRNTPPDFDERILNDRARLGEEAPNFTLPTRSGNGKISLSDYRGKRPVVLLFGSCT